MRATLKYLSPKSDLFDVSQIVRSQKIREFQSQNDFKSILVQKDISDETGDRFSNLVSGLCLVDFCFGLSNSEILTLYLIYADGRQSCTKF